MPTYEYLCDTCETVFEVYQSFTDDALTECPGETPKGDPTGCDGKGKLRKVYGNVGIAFKGAGFYANDSRSGGKSSSSSSSSSSTSSSDSTSGSASTSSSSTTSSESTTTSSSSSSSSD